MIPETATPDMYFGAGAMPGEYATALRPAVQATLNTTGIHAVPIAA